jgi:tripartite-type tricarboxylate transporter receptor subunit TctC
VPRLIDLATTPDQNAAVRLISSSSEFGRSVFFPPGVPAERVTALRRAFDEAMKDPEFLADAHKRQLPIEPQSGETLNRIAREVVSASRETVALAKKLLSTK